MKGIFDTAANIMADHEFGKLLAVDEYDPFTKEIRGLPGRR